jgi:heme/copper-type cytochrome/quinol oxidase subunit 4
MCVHFSMFLHDVKRDDLTVIITIIIIIIIIIIIALFCEERIAEL